MTSLILAAGEQSRWLSSGFVPKQLVLIDSEPLIVRTQRQLQERGQESFVITHHPEIALVSTNVFKPAQHRWTLETMLSTSPLWQEKRINILLGDVIYSKALMDKLVNCQAPIQFFHTLQRASSDEILAISFDQSQAESILKSLKQCLRKAAKGHHGGTLWYLYRHLNNLTYYKHLVLNHDMIVEVLDYSLDFDYPQHYEIFLKEVLQKNRLDDLPKL